MITISQRIYSLRSEKKLSKADLSAALNLPPKTVERFESGKLTPSKAQQQLIANYFGISLAYLRGETNDPTRQDSWMDMTYAAEREETPPPKKEPVIAPTTQSLDSPLLDALLNNPTAKASLQKLILETLQTKEGQEIIKKISK